jgi:hypothetical protein
LGQNVWVKMSLGQNDRGRSERDEMSVGRSECNVVYGTKSNGTKCMGAKMITYSQHGSLNQSKCKIKAVSAIPAGLKCETRNNCSSDNQRV